MHRMDYPPTGHPSSYGLPPLGPPPPSGYFHHDPTSPLPRHSAFPPPHHHHGPAYWSPSPYWSPPDYGYPYHQQVFSNPPSTPNSSFDVSPDCLSPLDQTVEHQWYPATDVSSRASPVPQQQKKGKVSLNVSLDDGYETNATEQPAKKLRRHSTIKQPLPEDPKMANSVMKRRERNKWASRKSRERLNERAEKGDRYEKILTGVVGHLKNMGIELEKLHLTNVTELLRQTGMDAARLEKERAELEEMIRRELTLDGKETV